MAITTLDGLIAGYLPDVNLYKVNTTAEAAGIDHALLNINGIPAATGAPAPGINGAQVTASTTGFPPYSAAGGGLQKYLARVTGRCFAAVAGIDLYDVLWWNSGLVVTTTTPQAITPVALPNRDDNGSSNGQGVRAWIWVSTATTNASAVTNTTMSYTNQGGTPGRTATIQSFPATAVAGAWVPFILQGGDTGVRSVQSVTLGTSYGAGVIHLVLARRLATLVPQSGVGPCAVGADFAMLGMPKTYDGTALAATILPTTTTVGANGVTLDLLVQYAEG